MRTPEMPTGAPGAPAQPDPKAPGTSPDTSNPDANTTGAPEEESTAPVQISETSVKIMGIELLKSQEVSDKVPNPERFKDFSEDDYSIALMQKIAKAVALNQPLLIEGEQAIGKTISVEYLAYLLNKPVYRMSLNGQTDVTDLIGKWVPRTEGIRKKIENLLKNPDECTSEEAKKLIKRKTKIEEISLKELRDEGQPGMEVSDPTTAEPKIGLTKEEMELIATWEGIEVPESEWAWQNGDIPKQMLEGAWSVLDEVNTCEPQILVRLNAVLEKGGQLVLHEDGSKVIPRHEDFRLFATVNPPGGDFKGRVPLSAEWISRWNYQNLGQLPKEVFKARLALGFGCKAKEPELKDVNYLFPSPIPEESKMTDFYPEEWLEDLATKMTEFIYEAIKMVKGKEIGKSQEQKFVFDQRDSIRFLEYLKEFHEVGKMKEVITDAVEYLFVNKCKTAEDREKLRITAFGLLKVDEWKEPVINKEAQGALAMEKEVRRMKATLLSMDLPEDVRKRILGIGEAPKS